MGVDLKLLIVDGDSVPYSHTMLELDRAREFWPHVEKLKTSRFDKPLSSYCSRVPDGEMQGESCYGKTETTPYGDELFWVYAKDLTGIPEEHLAPFLKMSQFNRAAWAYLAALPPKTRVGLYWH